MCLFEADDFLKSLAVKHRCIGTGLKTGMGLVPVQPKTRPIACRISIAFDRGGGTSSNLGGPLLNYQLQCSLGGASRHLARTFSQVHFGLEI